MSGVSMDWCVSWWADRRREGDGGGEEGSGSGRLQVFFFICFVLSCFFRVRVAALRS